MSRGLTSTVNVFKTDEPCHGSLAKTMSLCDSISRDRRRNLLEYANMLRIPRLERRDSPLIITM